MDNEGLVAEVVLQVLETRTATPRLVSRIQELTLQQRVIALAKTMGGSPRLVEDTLTLFNGHKPNSSLSQNQTSNKPRG